MKLASIILFVIATLPLHALGEGSCSEELMNAESDMVFVSCNDYFSIEKFIPFNRKGSPSIRKDFLTSYIKPKADTKSHDEELLDVHNEIERLSNVKNVGIAVPLDFPFYDLESSYHGNIVTVRIYEGAIPTDEEGKKWLNDANALRKKMYLSIVEQIAPNQSKQ